MHPELLSLCLFMFVTSCSPGPNNIVASHSGFNHGFKKTIPLMLGVIFGFTFMIWQHFYKTLNANDYKFDFSNAILIHGGGWKKLISESVSNKMFKEYLYFVLRLIINGIIILIFFIL